MSNRSSNVVHGILQVGVDFNRRNFGLGSGVRHRLRAVEVVGHIHPLTSADNVSIVRRRADADSLGGPAEQVAKVVG